MSAGTASTNQVSPGRAFAGLLGLTGFAFTQPTLSVFGENPIVFAAAEIDGWRLVALGLLLAVGPALLLWLGWIVVRRIAPPLTIPTLALFATGLLGLAAMQWAKAIGVDNSVLRTTLAAMAAATFGAAYLRYRPVRDWAALTAPLPLLAAGLFLFSSPAADLVRQPDFDYEPGVAGSDQPTVVLLLLDEFPTLSLINDAGDIDNVRFPNLADFAQTATWYRNFTTVAPNTSTVVPSLLSGQRPSAEEAVFANYPDNLFTAFAPTHHLTAFETVTKLCGFSQCSEQGPSESLMAPDRDYGGVLRQIGSVWRDRIHPGRDPVIRYDEFEEAVVVVEPEAQNSASPSTPAPGFLTQEHSLAKPERFERFLNTLSPDTTTLYYLHLVLPHSPFRFYPSGADYSSPIFDATTYPFSNQNDLGEPIAALTQQRHLLQAQYTDRLVGELLDRLEQEAMFEDALIAIVSDHGASFQPNTPFRSAAVESLESVAYVPFLLKLPGQSVGTVDPANLQSTDVFPIIASLANVDLETPNDGVFLGSDELEARGENKVMFETGGTAGRLRDIEEAVEFTITATAPDAGSRLIGSIEPGGDVLAGLHRYAGVEALVGQRFSAVRTQTTTTASILGRQEYADALVPPIGIFEGFLTGEELSGPVVVGFNGEIVGGSRVASFPPNDRFFAMMFPERFIGQPVEVQIGVLTDSGVVEIAVDSWG